MEFDNDTSSIQSEMDISVGEVQNLGKHFN